MAHILIIDDDVQLCKALAMVISSMGHKVQSANFLVQGLDMARQGIFDVVVLDIGLPDGNGLEALPQIRASKNKPEVIILSASSDPDGAELAIRSGAWGYIPKPPTLNNIKLPVTRAIEYHRQKLSRSAAQNLKRDRLIGESEAMQNCLELVAQAAETDANALICGETGTGKEVVARTIHENSSRAGNQFVVVDCAALPETLVESMLFGHEKGAYTGAERRAEGLVRQAHKGTLFLDEVGELPLGVQKNFLRVLQEHRFRPVGGHKEEESDFRLLAATNRDLDQMVATWDFRQDLLFRIRTIAVEVAPLRQRNGDVRLLVRHFTAKVAERTNAKLKECSSDLFEALEQYAWPGNVRELSNAMESAIAAAGDEETLLPRHLPLEMRVQFARQTIAAGSDDNADNVLLTRPDPENFPSLKVFRERVMGELERQYLRDLLLTAHNDVSTACRLSELSRARLYALLKKHNLSRKELAKD